VRHSKTGLPTARSTHFDGRGSLIGGVTCSGAVAHPLERGVHPPPCEPLELGLVGAQRLRREVDEALLPGPPPSCVGEDELDEVDRRLWTLGLSSAVTGERGG
jgi:hypothetical protein